MADACRPGRILEIGGGSGNFKSFRPDVVSTDVQYSPWLDGVCDAHDLPFADGSFDNIVMVDVLHHLERPRRFFEAARRVLRAEGRLVMVEPCVTPVSWALYKLFHAEPIDMAEDVLALGQPTRGRDPYLGNQAIPTLLFGRRHADFERIFPEFAVRAVERFAFFAYPLSGGFRPWSLLPKVAVRPLLSLESALAPVLGKLMGFRMLVVVERTG